MGTSVDYYSHLIPKLEGGRNCHVSPYIYISLVHNQFMFDEQVKIEKGVEEHAKLVTVKATRAKKPKGPHAGKDNEPTFSVITKETRVARDNLLFGKNKVSSVASLGLLYILQTNAS